MWLSGAAFEGVGDEVAEEGVGTVGLALEFGVELDGDEPGVVLDFDDLDEGDVSWEPYGESRAKGTNPPPIEQRPTAQVVW